jgi:hypothetical protein
MKNNRNGFLPTPATINKYNKKKPVNAQHGGNVFKPYFSNGIFVSQGIRAWNNIANRIEFEPQENYTLKQFMARFFKLLKPLMSKRIKSRGGTKVCYFVLINKFQFTVLVQIYGIVYVCRFGSS